MTPHSAPQEGEVVRMRLLDGVWQGSERVAKEVISANFLMPSQGRRFLCSGLICKKFPFPSIDTDTAMCRGRAAPFIVTSGTTLKGIVGQTATRD